MKVSREQAAENRARIVAVAGRLFRARGFDGVGVAGLMSAAGLTHGGFYGHFSAKDELAAEACEHAAARSIRWWEYVAAKHAAAPLDAILDHYLSPRHRDSPDQGCLYAALATDVARQDNPALRQRFTAGLRASIAILVRLLPGRSQARRRQRALAGLSTMVGALILARAVDDAALSEEILTAARATLGHGKG